MKHEIKNRFTGEVLFSCEVPEGMESGMIARHAVEAAIAERANLWDANLRDANLWDANLQGANLWDANLRDANLRDANLQGANLWDANLQGADLRGADLQGANLRDANLRDADLRGADLRGADLRDADLQGADLQGANLWDADLQGADLQGADLWDAKNAPLIITGLRWVVYISGTGNMRIGCQNHSIKHWDNFSDELINRMDDCALEFWKQHKEMLMGICNSYKHKNEKST